MGRIRFLVSAAAILAAGFGCSDSRSYVDWPVGLHLHGTATEEVVSKDFKDSAGSVAESKGTLGSGSFAGESSGRRATTRKTTAVDDWTVVGSTRFENPLVPGDPAFSDVPVAIVEATTVTSGTQETIETTVEEQPAGSRHEYTDRAVTTIDRETKASTYGLAGDEYVVRVSDLGLLWEPDLVETWHETGTPLAGLDELVRADVAVGDFWVTPDGTTLCRGIARERVAVGGGRIVTAVKVELRRVESANGDPGVVERCLVVPSPDDATSRWTTQPSSGWAGDGETDVRKVVLDPGCAGTFAHYRIGSQWWSGNVLVAEDTTTFEITIKDYGWEWMDYQGGKTRRTARSMDPGSLPGDAKLFAEYTLSTRHRTFFTDTMENAGTPWGK